MEADKIIEPPAEDKPEKTEEEKKAFLEKRNQIKAKWEKEPDIEIQQNELDEDIDAAEARQDAEDKKIEEGPITYTPLGGEICPVSPDDEHIEYCIQYRIPRIENLEACTKLKVCLLRVCLTTYVTCVGIVFAQELDQEDRELGEQHRA